MLVGRFRSPSKRVIDYPCPRCGAMPGQKCVKQSGKFRRIMLNFHKER